MVVQARPLTSEATRSAYLMAGGVAAHGPLQSN